MMFTLNSHHLKSGLPYFNSFHQYIKVKEENCVCQVTKTFLHMINYLIDFFFYTIGVITGSALHVINIFIIVPWCLNRRYIHKNINRYVYAFIGMSNRRYGLFESCLTSKGYAPSWGKKTVSIDRSFTIPK